MLDNLSTGNATRLMHVGERVRLMAFGLRLPVNAPMSFPRGNCSARNARHGHLIGDSVSTFARKAAVPGGIRPRFSPARPPRAISSRGCCNTRNWLRVGLWRGRTGYHSEAREASGRRTRDIYDCCFRLPPRQGLRSYARPGSSTARTDGCGDYGVLKRRSVFADLSRKERPTKPTSLRSDNRWIL
jgi:hypothetical protein